MRHPTMPETTQEATVNEPVTGPPVFLLDFDNFHVVHNEPDADSPV